MLIFMFVVEIFIGQLVDTFPYSLLLQNLTHLYLSKQSLDSKKINPSQT